MSDLVLISGGRLMDPGQGLDGERDILVGEGRVLWIGQGHPPQEPGRVLPARGLVVSPGFVDLHCHLREPGQEEKETMASGTLAACRGGFTTLCAMPNTRPPVDSPPLVEFLKEKALKEGLVRVLPIGALTKGRVGKELVEMEAMARAGAVAFSDDGHPTSSGIMRQTLEFSRHLGLPIMDHCEDLELSREGQVNEGVVSLRLGLKGMPSQAEEAVVARNVSLAGLTGGHIHVHHVSCRGSLEYIRRAKEMGVKVTCEVTPHHLTLTEDRLLAPIPYDTNLKVNPPLRSEQERKALAQALREGLIDAVATDHAPHSIVDKLVEFSRAAPGMSNLETALGSLMALVHRDEIDLLTLVACLTIGPARILGKELGSLKVGWPADVVLFDPDREWTVDPQAFASRGKNTPLGGEKLRGKVMATLVSGKPVFLDPSLKLEEARRVEI
jgi:dihydroorotase